MFSLLSKKNFFLGLLFSQTIKQENNLQRPSNKNINEKNTATKKIQEAPAAILKGIPLPNGITFNRKVWNMCLQ